MKHQLKEAQIRLAQAHSAMTRSYYYEQLMVVISKEDLVNHGRTTLRNGQMTEVDGQSSQHMHLSEYLNDAWASQVLVS